MECCVASPAEENENVGYPGRRYPGLNSRVYSLRETINGSHSDSDEERG
jgi:hypothetical protein